MSNAFQPLAGLEVVELAEFVSGPFCGKLLADLGARVTKIEPEGGDAARRWGPFPGDTPDLERSGLFLYLNRHKRLAPRHELPRLLSDAAVVIVDRAADLPVGPAGGEQVIVAVTPFGLSGPRARWRSSDLIVAAASGIMSLTGSPDREPLRPGGMILLHQAGLLAAIAALLQLATGRGAVVEVTEQEAAAWSQGVSPRVTFEGLVARRMGPRLSGAFGVGLQETRDGKYLMSGFLPERSMWDSLAGFLGHPPWMADPRFQSPLSRSDHAEEVQRRAAAEFARFTLREAVESLQARHVPVGPVNTFEDIATCEQLQARGFWVGTSTVPEPGPPAQVQVVSGAAPATAPLRRSMRPLDGVTVLDFSRLWAGPVVTRILAENGARVIKVESRSRPDPARFILPLAGEPPEGSGFFQAWNFGKLSVTLNLKHPKGVEIARALAVRSDVVVENFAPGVLDRLGLGWTELRKGRADLIMLSVSGLGQTGPKRHWVVFGEVIDALAGLMHLTGYPDRPPTLAASACGDPVSGLMGALYVLAALRVRERTGRGAYIDLSMYQTIVGMLSEPAMDWALNRRALGRQGNADHHYTVHGVFPCRGEDRWLAVAADGHQAERLYELAGTTDLASWTMLNDDRDLAEKLQLAGIAAAEMASIADLFMDPQLRARGFIREVDHPVTGRHSYFALPCRIGTGEIRPAPRLGEHTGDVLREDLCLPEEEIAKLEADGVLE